MLAQIQHEIRAVHAFDRRLTLQFAHPNHRHTVGCAEQRAIENIAKLRIVLRFAHSMHASDSNVTALSVPRRVDKKFSGAILIEDADANAEYVNFLNRHSEQSRRIP